MVRMKVVKCITVRGLGGGGWVAGLCVRVGALVGVGGREGGG